MCGIIGLINPKKELFENFQNLSRFSLEKITEGMLSLIEHRGPDEFGALLTAEGFLASARLAIIDIDKGSQPICNETRDIWVVFNGEIYDVKEHIGYLKKKGHFFKTRTDTEVLVHMYEEFGEEFPKYLNGEFAFCLYDLKKRAYFLVRDYFGTKPLFTAKVCDGVTLFSSEIKPLLWALNIQYPRLSREGIIQTLESWVQIPPKTTFEEIRSVPQAACIRFDQENPDGFINFYKYSSQNILGLSRPKDLYHLVELSVRRRLIADVPVGIYISGGIDSAILAGLSAKNSDHELLTFSVEFDNPQFDESSAQKAVQKKIQSKHFSIRIKSSDINQNFRSAVILAEAAVFRSAFVPMLLLSKRVNEEGIKVILTGEGADELFGGYDLYRELLILSKWAVSPNDEKWSQLLVDKIYSYLPMFQKQANTRLIKAYYSKFLGEVLQPFGGHKIRWSNLNRSVLVEPPVSSLSEATILQNAPKVKSLASGEQCRMVEIMTLLHGYLLSTQGDRMASAHSIEIRQPFLDRDVMQYAFSKSVFEFIDQDSMKEKTCLYSDFEGIFPNEIQVKRKTPFLAPDAEVFLDPASDQWWQDYFSEEVVRRTEVFDPKGVRVFLNNLDRQFQSGRGVSRKDNTTFFVLLSALILFCDIGKSLTFRPITKNCKWIKLVDRMES